MVETLLGLASGAIAPTAQDPAQATLARPLKKEDGRIDWSLPARAIYNRMRGFQPWPGASTSFRGKRIAIWGKSATIDLRKMIGPTGAFGKKSAIADSDESGQIAPGTIRQGGSFIYVACGDGSALQLESVQIEGRKRVAAREFANGARIVEGERFGS
jgi:methionyl-tRNA formyltransferase